MAVRLQLILLNLSAATVPKDVGRRAVLTLVAPGCLLPRKINRCMQKAGWVKMVAGRGPGDAGAWAKRRLSMPHAGIVLLGLLEYSLGHTNRT